MRVLLVLTLLVQFFTSGFLQAEIPQAPAAVVIYDNSLAAGWENWSWGMQPNFSSTSPTHSGSASITVQFTQGWDGLQLVKNNQPPSNLANNTLEFWVNGGSSGGQTVQVSAGNDCASITQNVTLSKNTWTKVSLSLAGLGTPAPLQKLVWFNNTSGTQPAFYLDDISLTSNPLPPPAVTAGPALTVNASTGQHAISPLIYGLNFPDESLAAELRLPVQRWGGNSTTRYNYLNDISNHAFDWYFENLPNYTSKPPALPDGSSADLFIEQGIRTGTQTLLTVPLIGWTPKDPDPKNQATVCGFNVAKYGPQQSTDPWASDCGNGVYANGSGNITGSAPTDTSQPITPVFVQNWMQYLIGKYGTANSGGVRFYNLDNEPMLWNSTQRDVHPQPTSYDELRDRTVAYAAAIKAVDPAAQTLGPVLWGWTAYFYSALDEAPGGAWYNNPLDRLAHGGLPFVEWYLQQMKTYQQNHNQRILDYLDLHYYPQSFESAANSAGDAATQQLRLRSTRSLWDPAYMDESWIADTVKLLPRMRDWVNTDYPGTKLALSEYSWGAMCHYSGALAEADVLGIFGREGLDLATLWGPPLPGEPGANAFRMYRNVDGSGNGFGETSVQATSANSDQLAVYAALRSRDGDLSLMVINKTAGPLSASLALSGFAPGSSAQAYRFSSDQQNKIVPLPSQPLSVSGFQAVYPGYSITLYLLPPVLQQRFYYLPGLKKN